jgi:Na+/melibiose symporter-like transporter
MSAPASNNAALDIMPGKVAAVTGIRGMFRQTGGTLGTATVVFVTSLFADEGRGLQVVFFSLSLFILLIIPVVFFIPDTARQRRKAARGVAEPLEPSETDGDLRAAGSDAAPVSSRG